MKTTQSKVGCKDQDQQRRETKPRPVSQAALYTQVSQRSCQNVDSDLVLGGS